MYVVGLTGGIGSGKSTVARMLEDRGATVIDADAVAREVVAPGTDGFTAVVERFGEVVVAADGSLDRKRLAGVAFGSPDAREDLNAIVHPRVGQVIADRLAALADTDAIVVIDVPLLVEVGAQRAYRDILVVTAPEDVRVQRLVADRGMDPEDVRQRIAAQANDEERLAVATHVIDNGGGLDALESQVDEVWDELERAAAADAA